MFMVSPGPELSNFIYSGFGIFKLRISKFRRSGFDDPSFRKISCRASSLRVSGVQFSNVDCSNCRVVVCLSFRFRGVKCPTSNVPNFDARNSDVPKTIMDAPNSDVPDSETRYLDFEFSKL